MTCFSFNSLCSAMQPISYQLVQNSYKLLYSYSLFPHWQNSGRETSWNKRSSMRNHFRSGIRTSDASLHAHFTFKLCMFLLHYHSGQPFTWRACNKIWHARLKLRHWTWSHKTNAPAILMLILGVFSFHPHLETELKLIFYTLSLHVNQKNQTLSI